MPSFVYENQRFYVTLSMTNKKYLLRKTFSPIFLSIYQDNSCEFKKEEEDMNIKINDFDNMNYDNKKCKFRMTPMHSI